MVSGSQVVSAAGTQDVSLTGLSASTTYYGVQFVQKDGSDYSNVAVTADFTTDDPPPPPITEPQLATPWVEGTESGAFTPSGRTLVAVVHKITNPAGADDFAVTLGTKGRPAGRGTAFTPVVAHNLSRQNVAIFMLSAPSTTAGQTVQVQGTLASWGSESVSVIELPNGIGTVGHTKTDEGVDVSSLTHGPMSTTAGGVMIYTGTRRYGGNYGVTFSKGAALVSAATGTSNYTDHHAWVTWNAAAGGRADDMTVSWGAAQYVAGVAAQFT
jgi:hypothetical protein